MDNLKWYERAGANNDVVRSSRMRLARNLKKYSFPCKAGNRQKIEVIDAVRHAFMSGSSLMPEQFRFIMMEDLGNEEAISMAERHIISPDFISDPKGKAVILSQDESISIMINEEDHIRIQVLKEGDALQDCFETADRIDSLLSEHLDYAYNEKLGYLTQCPTNLGTGMRVSYMMHLPALTELGIMQRMAGNLSKLGITIRGTYGEASKVTGLTYQISNQITLGLSEKEAIANLNAIAGRLVAQEREERENLAKNLHMQDHIYQSAGILKTARVLTSDTFMNRMSYVRIGISAGLLSGIDNQEIDRLTVLVQPATLMTQEGRQMTEDERDIRRAELVRAACKGIKEEA